MTSPVLQQTRDDAHRVDGGQFDYLINCLIFNFLSNHMLLYICLLTYKMTTIHKILFFFRLILYFRLDRTVKYTSIPQILRSVLILD